jgi:hypothetical protein
LTWAFLNKRGLCICYVCQSYLSTYSQTCEDREHEFHLCKEHKHNFAYLMVQGRCVYCIRFRNDTISKLLKLVPADAVLTEAEKRVIEGVNRDAASQ